MVLALFPVCRAVMGLSPSLLGYEQNKRRCGGGSSAPVVPDERSGASQTGRTCVATLDALTWRRLPLTLTLRAPRVVRRGGLDVRPFSYSAISGR